MAPLTVLPLIEQVTSRVIRILGCNPGPLTLQGTNSYLIGTGRRRILLDTSDSNRPDYIATLRDALHNLEIQELIITHWEPDHVGSIMDVCKEFIPGAMPRISKVRRTDAVEPYEGDDIPYTYIQDGHIFTTEGATLRTIYTPGHTVDHISLLLEEENSIFTGDCVLGEGTCVFENLPDYMSSLKRLLKHRPALILPAHGGIVNNPIQHLTMYINHRNMREKQILDLLEQNKKMTAMHLVQLIYHDIPFNLYLAAENNVKLHLGKLMKEDKIETYTVNGCAFFMLSTEQYSTMLTMENS